MPTTRPLPRRWRFAAPLKARSILNENDKPSDYVPRRKGAWPRPLPLSMPLMLRGRYRPSMGGSGPMLRERDA